MNLEGHLLIASPHLQDENFFRSVIWIAEHDWEGASGIVLNQPGADSLEEIWDVISFGAHAMPFHAVDWGGPCDGPVFAIHRSPFFGFEQSTRGIRMSDDQAEIKRLVKQCKYDYRLFWGYASWEPNQLEDEIRQGDWLTIKAIAGHLFCPADTLWQKLIHQIGNRFLRDHLNIKHIPKQTSLN